jgi:glutaredoxin
MESLSIVVYTMKGCPFCTDFKEMLTKEGIEFFDRDIDDYKDEYDIFVEVTDNDMIPAMLIIEGNDEKHESFLYAPERNYNELSEAVTIIQGHRQKLGLI